MSWGRKKDKKNSGKSKPPAQPKYMDNKAIAKRHGSKCSHCLTCAVGKGCTDCPFECKK